MSKLRFTLTTVTICPGFTAEKFFAIAGINTSGGDVRHVSPFVARAAAQSDNNMKKITLTLICLAAVTMSVVAQEQPAADNSAKNQRDRSGETMTSGDQSNSPEDTKLTASIRRAVVADKSLSMTAKNVKITAANGVVTLRGPVKTDAEKATVEKLAQSAAGGAKIDNQLEVKASE